MQRHPEARTKSSRSLTAEEETLIDVRADFQEIEWRAQAIINAHSIDQSSIRDVLAEFAEIRDMAAQERSRIADTSTPDIADLLRRKHETRVRLRSLQSVLAGATSAPRWQAPASPYDGSATSKILGILGVSNNEYVRGGYQEEHDYAKKFVSNYIESGSHRIPRAYLTSSGMAACTTALLSLKKNIVLRDTPGTILVGESTYFENKWLLERLFPHQVIYFDEFNAEELLALAEKHTPSVVFLDSLGNDDRLAIPDLDRILPTLLKILPLRSTIVIDNSCLGAGYQPLRALPRNMLGAGLVVIESLNKFYEFGSDRVTAGIIWTSVLMSSDLELARIHLGTMIPDASLAALPEPDKRVLDFRMQRVERNSSLIASMLQDHLLQNKNSVLSHVEYPGLPTYPGYAWSQKLSFKGCFVALRLRKPYRNKPYYSILISRILKTAHERGVSIEHGTSFGFDTTRISVAAFYADKPERAFLRIAIGTETKLEIEKVASIIAGAL